MYPQVAISFKSEEYRGVIVTFMRILDRFAWNCTIGTNTYGDFIVLAPQKPDRIEPQEAMAAAHIISQASHMSIDTILNRGNDGFNKGDNGGGEPEPKPTPTPTGGEGVEVEEKGIVSPFAMAVAGGVVALPI